MTKEEAKKLYAIFNQPNERFMVMYKDFYQTYDSPVISMRENDLDIIMRTEYIAKKLSSVDCNDIEVFEKIPIPVKDWLNLEQ